MPWAFPHLEILFCHCPLSYCDLLTMSLKHSTCISYLWKCTCAPWSARNSPLLINTLTPSIAIPMQTAPSFVPGYVYHGWQLTPSTLSGGLCSGHWSGPGSNTWEVCPPIWRGQVRSRWLPAAGYKRSSCAHASLLCLKSGLFGTFSSWDQARSDLTWSQILAWCLLFTLLLLLFPPHISEGSLYTLLQALLLGTVDKTRTHKYLKVYFQEKQS